jgi:hypothetical protein
MMNLSQPSIALKPDKKKRIILFKNFIKGWNLLNFRSQVTEAEMCG